VPQTRPKTPQIIRTKNYRQFTIDAENRDEDPSRHKALRASMQAYGFLSCFPIVCTKRTRRLVVKDGQHRLLFAEEMDLPVYYVIEEVDFNIAAVNAAPKVWALRDYAVMYARNGRKAYSEGLVFSEVHGIPTGLSFALLAGTTTFTNIKHAFIAGKFQTTDFFNDTATTEIYTKLVAMEPSIKHSTLLQACMGVCRVKAFRVGRMIKNAGRCRQKLLPYSTVLANLDMLEAIYNFGQSKLFPIKLSAQTVMRERSAVQRKSEAT
jgi:hypothetical protein